jgi:hypothetical protein
MIRAMRRAMLPLSWLLLAVSCGESETTCSDGDVSFREGDPCETCTCRGGEFSCETWECVTPDCPPPSPVSGECAGGPSYAKDPETGACCRYDNDCEGPPNWLHYAGQGECLSRHCEPGARVPAGDGCNECICNEQGSVWLCGDAPCSPDTPPPGEACGFFEGGCDDGEYCAFDPIEACSSTDAPSVCRVQPETCTDDDAPACGCNGTTYGSRCLAAQAGVGILDMGPCPEWSADTTCGGATGNDCTADEYCAYAECGQSDDDTGQCRFRPRDCVPQRAPVCGCDGRDYANACEAARAGVSVSKSGSCS